MFRSQGAKLVLPENLMCHSYDVSYLLTPVPPRDIASAAITVRGASYVPRPFARPGIFCHSHLNNAM